MARLLALVMALALVPACEHMGKGGGGGGSFGHSSWGGSSGGGGGGGGHAPSSALSSSGGSSSSSHSSSHPSSSSLAERTADGVVETAAAVGEAMLENLAIAGSSPVTVTPVGQTSDPDAMVGDLCLDCPDAGNCDSCPAGPRGAP
ncbi:MAG TPA: hypothetical protein VMJ10_23735 [Kofleriaceae bacterium]|nr:hypothetical protein [Kofleriaceae bacterium]